MCEAFFCEVNSIYYTKGYKFNMLNFFKKANDLVMRLFRTVCGNIIFLNAKMECGTELLMTFVLVV